MRMGKEIYAVFVAGGSGSRMGSDLPKQFLGLGGEPILQHTLEVFADAVPRMKAIVVLPALHFPTWKRLCAERLFECPHTLVEGGITRFQSVRNALEKVPDGAVVMIHDGVRPLVSAALIHAMLERMETCQALIPVLPVTDTLRLEGASGSETVDRSRYVSVQTPQMFRSELVKAAYARPYDTRYTDDASVVQAYGVPPETIPGERFNIKITTPEDLLLAEAILSLKRP